MFKKLFKKQKKKNDIQVFAPLSGHVIPLEEVPDPVFSEKMMGEGIAVQPTDSTVVSPVDGEIVQVAPTKHAVGIRANDGSELLIHVGLETVTLKGDGFNMVVKQGDKVKVGQPLLHFEFNTIKQKAKSMITPIVITNSADSGKHVELTTETEAQAKETILITIS